jgi:hypothetical protein
MRTDARLLAALALVAAPAVARAEWVRDSTSLAWRANGETVWRFSFDPKSGKPFFDPVSVAGGPSLTNFKPEDHPWHYGLWFSWKYINHVNYWEEDRRSGQAAGATRWGAPTIATRPDGSATIRLAVTYARTTGEVDLTETRVLTVSAPSADGAYSVDWDMRFRAGSEGAALDRTPMPGEPNGAVNGGYAGLSVRLAASPLSVAFTSTEGAVTEFTRDRARPWATAVGASFARDGRDAGAIAVLTDAANVGTREDGKAPWYLINAPAPQDFRFLCAAVLAPSPRTIPAGGELRLRYRVALRRAAWTPEALDGALRQWRRTLGGARAAN